MRVVICEALKEVGVGVGGREGIGWLREVDETIIKHDKGEKATETASFPKL